MTTTSSSLHKEIILEEHLVQQLTDNLGYTERKPADYDRKFALDTGALLEFVRETQPTEWKKLEEQYADNAEAELLKQLERALKSRGTLDVLRQGLKLIPNIHLRFCYFQPASGLNAELLHLYESNRLTVIRQLRYSLKNKNEIDVALFLNGIPVATLELKNPLTNSSFKDAELQYMKDRAPAGEPLLTFKRGALVHFALDGEDISMTTRLQNGKTRFLPFNRGNNGGAGNPDIPGDFRVAYLYRDITDGEWQRRAVFSREVLLAILGRFMHLSKEAPNKPEVMIFPRFQQLDAVLKMMNHARRNGSGHNYLIQHSAGSGKSNTIGWTAHQIINLHNDADEPIFDSAIIVTDRIVLDRQLQNTVKQFEQTAGVVKKIDGTSRQLKAAIESGARIIITTIQKFGTDHLKTVEGQSHRKFAILIDEAHSSQSGRVAQDMADALTRGAASSDDIEEIIAAYQRSRGPQPNISYFAFTATPRNVTLERFGLRGPDGKPVAFHLYSMRQAIEEGFILDVLQNYMTYSAYYKLEKTLDDDPKFQTNRAQRKVAKFAHLHPTAVSQKVEIIVEHFRRHVMHELDGNAKAMVVTASREAAVRYFDGLKDYLEDKGYTDMKALVAFSGDLDIDGTTCTEAFLNGVSEAQLPEKFDKEQDYRLLIVAEKYQTGFDQPKLCAMYVDRKLAGLQAVQTLSRLNRTTAGKTRTYILDFQNTTDDIQEAFRPYFQASTLEETSDPNQIYELEAKIRNFGILNEGEIDRFAETYFKSNLEPADRILLEGIIREAVGRYQYMEDGKAQEEFRQLLKSFMRFYSFVAQIVSLHDSSLEKLYTYASWLVRLLPDRENPPEVEITNEMLELRAFKVSQRESGSASLAVEETQALYGIKKFGANRPSTEEEKSLSEIIDSFNERNGTNFTKDEFIRFDNIKRNAMDEKMVEMLRNNPPDIVYKVFCKSLMRESIRSFQNDEEMRSIILTDEKTRDLVFKHLFNSAVKMAKESA